MDFHKIQPSDFEAVLNLLNNAFPLDRASIERDLKETQASPKAEGDIYGLWIDEELVGTAIYGACYDEKSSWNGEGIIRYLAIAPEHRRKGYATRIIQKMIEDLKQLGSPCVAVSVLLEDTVAVKIWESFGFEKFSDAVTDEYGTHQSYELWF